VKCTAACTSIAAALGASFAPALDGRYVPRDVRGFRVHVERELQRGELGRDALELLDHHLFEIEREVPSTALAKLRAVPIWLSKDDDVALCACYHPSADWLREHGHDPAKARGVEIANAATFLEWTHEQPSMVLHELAHAYHDQVLTHGHAGVRAAFERVRAAGTYESVLHANAQRLRHYALQNDQEFFAEASEAWFGTNDFYPFVRAELIDFDPETAQLMRSVWGE
jgi:hypothetical protein